MAEDNYEEENVVRPEVITVDDVVDMVPKMASHRKLIDKVLRWLKIDKVNKVHSACCSTPGPEFVKRLLYEQFNISLRVDNQEVLQRFPEGPFITVSNHPMGAMDGIILIYLVSQYRPKYRVMVNMILNKLSGMRKNFIAVDALASNDPRKRMVSVNGIRRVLRQLKSGEPVGFFPAGAVSKYNGRLQVCDREWQESVLQIIKKAKVPVIPIYFHDKNSRFFYSLGLISWKLRTLRLPREVFNKEHREMHITVGNPISVEEQERYYSDIKEFGKFLRQKTYALANIK